MVLRLLAKAQLDLGRAQNRAVCRLHALVASWSRAGSARKSLSSKPQQLLDRIEPATRSTQRQRLELAYEHARRHRAASTRDAKRSETRIADAVAASGTTLTDIFGVGPIVAATLIGHTGDIARFATADTSPPTTAPPRSSSSSGGRDACIGCRGAGTGR